MEKVWIDSYKVDAPIPTTSSLLIGRLSAGDILTDVVVYLPILSAAETFSTVYLDAVETTSLISGGGALEPTVVATATISTVRLGQIGAVSQMPIDVGLYLMIDPATTVTGGTIKTIIRYS